MGASPTRDEPGPLPVAVLSSQIPEIRLEDADADAEDTRVFVEGTMYHNGLNANAWGLDEAGAKRIATDLIGRDYTAAHPFIRGTRYDRSIADGQGAPIGEVRHTKVVSVDEAMLGQSAGYTAEYTAEVLDPSYKRKLANGLMLGDGYGVSIGIYADPEAATCSVCGQEMASEDCSHRRGEEVKIEKQTGETETQIAGPVYSDGEADHLAHVWMPAYEGADADVTTASTDALGLVSASVESAKQVPEAATVLAEPFDATDDTSETEHPDDSTPDGYAVRVSAATLAERRLRAQRGSYKVITNNG